MATLTGNSIASTYLKLLRITNDTMGADATAYYIQDSADTDSALSISTTRVGIGTAAPSEALHVVGTMKATVAIESGDMFKAGFNNNGTAGSPDYTFNGDTNTGMYSSTADNLEFSTASTERMRIDSSGNVGIGGSPAVKLHVKHNITNYVAKVHNEGVADDSHGLLVETDSTNTAANIFAAQSSGGSFYVKSGGNVGIGSANPHSPITISTTLDAADNADQDKFALMIRNHADDTNEEIGIGFRISSNQNADNAPGGAMTFERTSSNSVGSLHFKTAPSSEVLTTRMTIDSSGNIQFNAYGSGTLSTDASGNITASDERLKDKTRTLESGLDLVEQLSPTFFKWKEDSGLDQVIVQESIASVEAVEAQDAVYETVVTTEAQEEMAWDVELPTVDNTKDEIKSFMDEYSLEYNSGDTKQDLLDKIPSVKQEAIEEVTEEQLVSEAVEAVEGVEGQDEIKEYQGTEHLGFIAQEVQAVIPEASHSPRDPSRPLNYDDRGLIAVLVKAVQELSAKVESLENK